MKKIPTTVTWGGVFALVLGVVVSACGERIDARSAEPADRADVPSLEEIGVTARPMFPTSSPLGKASIFIETNCTDGDSGIQFSVDGESWDKLYIYGPHNNLIGNFTVRDGLGRLGLTELSFEGDEPQLVYPQVFGCIADEPEETLAEFLDNYPAGRYCIAARGVDNEWFLATAQLSHRLPRGPSIIAPAEGAPQDPNNFVVSWSSSSQPPGVVIAGHHVSVEVEDESADFKRSFDIDLGPQAASVTVPSAFFDGVSALSDPEMKVEVLVKATSGNQTITERPFELMP